MSALGDAGMNRFLDRSSILLTSTKNEHPTFVGCLFFIMENRTRESLNVKKVAGGKFLVQSGEVGYRRRSLGSTSPEYVSEAKQTAILLTSTKNEHPTFVGCLIIFMKNRTRKFLNDYIKFMPD